MAGKNGERSDDEYTRSCTLQQVGRPVTFQIAEAVLRGAAVRLAWIVRGVWVVPGYRFMSPSAPETISIMRLVPVGKALRYTSPGVSRHLDFPN